MWTGWHLTANFFYYIIIIHKNYFGLMCFSFIPINCFNALKIFLTFPAIPILHTYTNKECTLKAESISANTKLTIGRCCSATKFTHKALSCSSYCGCHPGHFSLLASLLILRKIIKSTFFHS